MGLKCARTGLIPSKEKKELEDKIISLVKNELKRFKNLLRADYPACTERQMEDKKDQSKIREGALEITLHFLRSMNQTNLAITLQTNLLTQTPVPLAPPSQEAAGAEAAAEPAQILPTSHSEPLLPAPERYAERAKVAYIISLLTGWALAWATLVWEHQTDVCSTAAEFAAALKRTFGHPVTGGRRFPVFLTCDRGEERRLIISARTKQRHSVAPASPALKRVNKDTKPGVDTKQSAIFRLGPREHEWLVKCAAGQQDQICQLLLQDIKLAEKRNFISGFTVLHWAAKQGNSEMVRKILLLSQQGGPGVDVNIKSYDGYTPLHMAAIHSHESVLSVLVRDYGANCNIRDNSGKKPYHYLHKDASPKVRELLGDPHAADYMPSGHEQHFSNPSKGLSTLSKLFHTDDVSEFTEAVVGFIGKLVHDTIPRITIKKFSNQKHWVDRTIHEALNSSTAAYNVGIISGNMDEYKSAAYGVRRAMREAKRRYGKKLETQFQQSGSRSLWQGLRMIPDYRSPPSGLMSADESLANELNTFFARFEATSSSTNANSVNANSANANCASANSASPNGTIGAANGTCAGPTIEQRPLIITESDVRRVFKRVKTRKAMGPDGICGRVLKACADQLAPVFTDIFNLSLTLGIVPYQLQVVHHRPRPEETSTLRPQ
ncbi:hypothetical protein P4O66_003692 [Electrophorus voltai]|uniref:Uncharacterized protein n=1 Tax=Electrophorus voltai TaxID=2609070 RepID=A0AAD8YQC9_9TELE|nr:hypothetical protein P4O66_003692 [Electrophorus voltai]